MENSIKHRRVAVIGYSGHSFVATDILMVGGYKVEAYCDREEKSTNPFSLQYLGNEADDAAIEWIRKNNYFIAIGDNNIRGKVFESMKAKLKASPVNAIHPSAIIASSVMVGEGVMVAAGAVINPLSKIGDGAICNTSCSIDHECMVGQFSHIGPGTILCGNVIVGKRSFVGAGAVVRQGIVIGDDVIIGAGAVIVKDVADRMIIVGNPQKELSKK